MLRGGLALGSLVGAGRGTSVSSRRWIGWTIPTASGIAGIVLMILLLMQMFPKDEVAVAVPAEAPSAEVIDETPAPFDVRDLNDSIQTDLETEFIPPRVASVEVQSPALVNETEPFPVTTDVSAESIWGIQDEPPVASQDVAPPATHQDPFWGDTPTLQTENTVVPVAATAPEPEFSIGLVLTQLGVPRDGTAINEFESFAVSSQAAEVDEPSVFHDQQWVAASDGDAVKWRATEPKPGMVLEEPTTYQGIAGVDIVDVPSSADVPGDVVYETSPTRQFSISLQKQIPANCSVGQILDCVLVIQNDGRNRATNFIVEQRLSPTVRVVNASPDAEFADGVLRWTITELQPGERAELTAQVIPTAEGTITSTAAVHSNVVLAGRTLVQPPELPELRVALHCPQQVAKGELGVLWFEIENVSEVPASNVALNVDLSDQLHNPFGSELIRPVGAIQPGKTHKAKLTVRGMSTGDAVIRAGATIGSHLADETGDVLTVVSAALRTARTETLELAKP
jgi:hypothetical protein